MEINVERNEPFSYPRSVVKKYGSFIIRESVEVSAKILKFSMNDLTLFDVYTDEMSKASKFQKMVLSSHHVPLDSYCAKAIYENKEALLQLQTLWFREQGYKRGTKLESIMFLGDTVSRDLSDYVHYSYLKFYPISDQVDFMPFEDDPGCVRNRDFILIFKDNFIKKLA